MSLVCHASLRIRDRSAIRGYHPMINFWIVPSCRSVHPAFDRCLQLGVGSLEVKRIEAVKDLLHQVTHSILVDMRDVRPGNASTIGIYDSLSFLTQATV